MNKYPKKEMDMSSYKVIPEHIMQSSAETLIGSGESDNSFSRMLLLAEEYKKAEMTPMFVLDAKNMDVYVVAKETFGKKLH
jgi:hypothetical protein